MKSLKRLPIVLKKTLDIKLSHFAPVLAATVMAPLLVWGCHVPVTSPQPISEHPEKESTTLTYSSQEKDQSYDLTEHLDTFTLQQVANNALSNGWSKPLSVYPNRGGYLGWLSGNPDFGGLHLAVDLAAAVGTPINSVSQGKILHKSTSVGSYGGVGKAGGGIVIEYQTSTGQKFYALYGHLKNLTHKNVGDSVSSGEKIGEIASYINGNGRDVPHLHFAIRTGNASNVWRGYGPSSLTSSEGWQNPVTFLDNHKPAQSTSSEEHGEFDGAASIVSASENGFGLNKDVAIMHPHPATGSTVALQVLKEAAADHIDVYATQDVEVILKMKPWLDHLTQQAYRIKFKAYQPVSIGLANGNTWSTMAFTSAYPLNQRIQLSFTAKKASDPWQSGTVQSITPTSLVDVTHNHFWTGTASLMSHAKRIGFATRKDDVVTFSQHNSLTSIQAFATSACSQVEIAPASGGTAQAIVESKVWDAPNTSYNQHCNSLPCQFALKSGFSIIKVKSNANAIRGGILRAQCK
jgi:murein DD-endopeptidase MepM/ murein hydrolase activator NlpD